jgi:RNA polymerase sigma-70 factor (sigma-E family)
VDFEEYVSARGPALLRFAYVLTMDRHSAEDLVQAALTDAYRHWRRVNHADHPEAYVRKIIVNLHLSRRRRLWRREQPSELIDGDLGRQARSEPDIADHVVERDAAREALDALPPRARTILVLRYYGDFEDRAIAVILGIQESTVRSTASRALTTLRGARLSDLKAAPRTPLSAGVPATFASMNREHR